MSIVRVEHNKSNPYVVLNKNPLEDKNVSWAAKGLWAYLMSRPDDWVVSVPHLKNIYLGKGGGERAIYSLIKELIKFGYCRRSQKMNEKGQFQRFEYVISELKIKIPDCSQPLAVEADAVESPPTKYRVKQSTEKQQQQKAAAAVVFSKYLFEGIPQDFTEYLFEGIPQDFTDQEMESILNVPDVSRERLALAIAFVKHPKTVIKKSRIATIIWHLKQKIPPLPPQEEVTPQQKLALEFNNKISQKFIRSGNIESIPKGHMVIWLIGKWTTISLNNPLDIIKQDFEDSLKELNHGGYYQTRF